MVYRLIIAVLLAQLSIYAELSIENEKDRKILEDSYAVASKILAKNSRDTVGNDLVKFSVWLDSEHPGIKAIKAKLVFGEAITPVGSDVDSGQLAKLLMERQAEINDQSTKALYTVMANKLDVTNIEAAVTIKQFQSLNMDLTLAKLIVASPKPKMVDLEVLEAERIALDKKIQEDNAKQEAISNASLSEKKLIPSADVDKMLDLVKFKNFSYSEGSVLDAINRLTHKMYWRGIQFTIAGNRISVTEEKTALNGAKYYYGPLHYPEYEEYNLTNKTIREILDHIAMNMDLSYSALDGEIALTDASIPELTNIPEEGLASSQLQNIMRDYKLADIQKYRGKVIKMNGIITGIGKGLDSRQTFFALDGGMIQLYALRTSLEEGPYKRLDTALDAWKKNEGLRKYRDALSNSEKTGEIIDRKSIAGGDKLYITFVAKCTGIDKGRLIFADPESIYLDGAGEFLLKKKVEKKVEPPKTDKKVEPPKTDKKVEPTKADQPIKK